MNINICPLKRKYKSLDVECPECHGKQFRKHGHYFRKGFHQKNTGISSPVPVARFRCTNPQCKRRTFSLLPPMILRYCRFFWPCLLTIWNAISRGLTPYFIAKAWNVDRAVIVRAAALRCTIQSFIEKQHQELFNGDNGTIRDLGTMVEIIALKIGPAALMNRWYCHRYPRRYFVF